MFFCFLILFFSLQESNVLIGHVVGAVLAFALGTLGYGWLQTIISYRTRLPGSSHTLCHFRLSLCLFGSVLFLVGILFPICKKSEQSDINRRMKTRCFMPTIFFFSFLKIFYLLIYVSAFLFCPSNCLRRDYTLFVYSESNDAIFGNKKKFYYIDKFVR